MKNTRRQATMTHAAKHRLEREKKKQKKNESVRLYKSGSHTVNEPTARHLHRGDLQHGEAKNKHTRTNRGGTHAQGEIRQSKRMVVIMTHSYATHSGACARAEHIKLSKCNTCSVSVLLPCTGM